MRPETCTKRAIRTSLAASTPPASASLTQEDLAHEASISTSTLSQIERGDYQPRMDTLGKLAQALKVPVAELLG
jgi:DNA-binding XRE family transcriptional regulator